jgi:hypothetical protein
MHLILRRISVQQLPTIENQDIYVYINWKSHKFCDIVLSISDNKSMFKSRKKKKPDNSSHESWPTPAAGKPHSVLVKNRLENFKS